MPITATLNDPDGVVGTVTWTWTEGNGSPPRRQSNLYADQRRSHADRERVSYDDKLTANDSRRFSQADRLMRLLFPNIYEVRDEQTSNSRPEFQDDEGNKITSTTREIEENAGSKADVDRGHCGWSPKTDDTATAQRPDLHPERPRCGLVQDQPRRALPRMELSWDRRCQR